MPLCINQSGTYRNIKTLCINNSGTYRELATGCINDSGTYRLFTAGFIPIRGRSYEGGFLICKQSPIRWVVSPFSAEVSRSWYNRDQANTRSQQVSGCTGWFVPCRSVLQSPGWVNRSFWGPTPCYTNGPYFYWSSDQQGTAFGWFVSAYHGLTHYTNKTTYCCVRAFRCVSY